jgi:hypothetical protein
MKIAPVPVNDWQALNLVIEEVGKSLGNNASNVNIVKKEISEMTAKVVKIETPPATIANTNPGTPVTGPSMAGYSPKVEFGINGYTRIYWSDWPGVNNADLVSYEIYASTETICTINSANLKTRTSTRTTSTSLRLTPGVTYDIRIRPVDKNGAGIASS